MGRRPAPGATRPLTATACAGVRVAPRSTTPPREPRAPTASRRPRAPAAVEDAKSAATQAGVECSSGLPCFVATLGPTRSTRSGTLASCWRGPREPGRHHQVRLRGSRGVAPILRGDRAEARKWVAAQGWPTTLVIRNDNPDLLGGEGWLIATFPLATWRDLRRPLGADPLRCRLRPCPTCKGPATDESAEWPDDPGGEQACHAWCTARERSGARVEVRLRRPVGPRTRARAVGIRRAVATFPGQPRGYVEVHRWARHFLGAMPRQSGLFDGALSALDEPGNPENRDALTVFADRLQTGDGAEPLTEADAVTFGEGLALWLTRAPCGTCRGKGTSGLLTTSTPMPGDREPPPVRRVPCLPCRGTCLALGALVPALEGVARRLTVGSRPMVARVGRQTTPNHDH